MENNNEENSFIETYKTFHSSFVKKFYFKVFIFGIIMLIFGLLVTIIIASAEGGNIVVSIVLMIIGLIVSITTLSYAIFYWNKWGKAEDILKKQEQEKMKIQQAKVEAQKKEKKIAEAKAILKWQEKREKELVGAAIIKWQQEEERKLVDEINRKMAIEILKRQEIILKNQEEEIRKSKEKEFDKEILKNQEEDIKATETEIKLIETKKDVELQEADILTLEKTYETDQTKEKV